ncbi:MAG: aspartate aminotransferase family protein [Lachnospiraceae bacterium]|nr:aspartate aminotransferase family protein [Lachnospiraceae bacterium]
MKTEDIKNINDDNLLHVYNRFDLVLDHGEGVYLYDNDGTKYLDFASGIGVSALGYGNKEYTDALHNQVDKLLHTSNLYYHEPGAKAAKAFCEASGMERVFFTNSGAEAIEGAIKAAKKYFYLKKGCTGANVIAMDHSFHGRTVGALSVTGTEHYREAFYPLMGEVRFANFNDLDSVKALIDENTCAVITETLQGEGGIYPATPEFLEGLRKLADENDFLLILDEIQCGMGRTGKMFCFQNYDVVPDIVTSAKALGLGVPVGCFGLSKRAVEYTLEPGDHGTTYGGNPLVTTAVYTSVDIMNKTNLPEHVKELAPYLEERLDAIVNDYEIATAHRGMGFMQGLVVKDIKPVEIVKAALKEGVILLTAGSDVVRMLPPLVIEKEHIDEMETKLRKVLDNL